MGIINEMQYKRNIINKNIDKPNCDYFIIIICRSASNIKYENLALFLQKRIEM
jgi:arylamine N-acetyltransferase